MLKEEELTDVWERQIQAEIRSLYFADLTTEYAKRKQFITFLNFFLASGAAATLIGKAPAWVAIVLSTLSALCSAYAVATGLDGKILILSKLHGEWSQLAIEYEKLRNHPEVTEAANMFAILVRRGLEASSLATTDAPYRAKLVERWTDHVFKTHGLEYA